MSQSAAKEDPALAERLKRVMGETSGRGTERRVFVGGMPFSYEACKLHLPLLLSARTAAIHADNNALLWQRMDAGAGGRCARVLELLWGH